MGAGLIAYHELEQLRKRYRVTLVDVREKEQYLRSHIPGAIHIAFEELMRHPMRMPAEGVVVFYCSKGNKSFRAALHFAARGYRAYSLKGGWPVSKTFH